MRLLTALVGCVVLGSCSSPPSLLDQIVLKGELRVVTQNSPTTFYYTREEPRGVEYDLLRGFAKRLGVDLRIDVTDQFWQVFPDVASGKDQIGAAGLTVTEPRRQIVDFGPTYQKVSQQVIYRRGTVRPRKIEDLIGGTVEVVAGSSHVGALERARAEHPELSWSEDADASPEQLIERVAKGEIDYTVVDSTSFQLLRQSYPEARAAFAIGPDNGLAWALPKDAPELNERVAAYFAEIEATGELQQILDRYYDTSRDFDYVGSRAFVRHLNTRLSRYRSFFEEAELDSGIDWRLLAAMSYQESHWNPDAVSPTGVRGLMMLTRHTASMVSVSDRRDPRQSVVGGARYFNRVLKKLPERIPEQDRLWMAVAAYNIGFGHLEDSRIITEIQGGNPDSWTDVRQRLPLLSDERWYKRLRRGYARGSVPVQYVDNVQRYYEMLQWMTADEILSGEPKTLEIAASTG